jgi:hypothetical protein
MREGCSQAIALVRISRLRPGLAEALRPLLEAHGATIEEQTDGCVVYFPQGTMQHHLFPFVRTMRSDIRFPDGYSILYEMGREGGTNLCFDPQDIPEDVRVRFEDNE